MWLAKHPIIICGASYKCKFGKERSGFCETMGICYTYMIGRIHWYNITTLMDEISIPYVVILDLVFWKA